MASRVSRAKQFLPFDALVGFREALKEKETEYEDKKELTEDSYDRLEIGKKAKIKYYKNKKYIEKTGSVTKIDYAKKRIEIDAEENISVWDIVEIEEK